MNEIQEEIERIDTLVTDIRSALNKHPPYPETHIDYKKAMRQIDRLEDKKAELQKRQQQHNTTK